MWPFSPDPTQVRQAVALEKIAANLFRLTQPDFVLLKILSEVGPMLAFELVLPPPGAADVVTRELQVEIAGVAQPPITVPASQTVIGGFTGNDNETVLTTLVDVDDAGNKSTARVQTFTLSDTIPPPQPGEIALNVISES